MQIRLTALCRFDPYSNSNSGRLQLEPPLKGIKIAPMKTLPAIFTFFVVYYVLWLLRLPLRFAQLFMQVIGD
ncbi:MAG: hypothetical protein JWO06_1101 [Bacteroidota bacterium]|nr:hypothetical protein [Bacteroidota bacterium]